MLRSFGLFLAPCCPPQSPPKKVNLLNEDPCRFEQLQMTFGGKPFNWREIDGYQGLAQDGTPTVAALAVLSGPKWTR